MNKNKTEKLVRKCFCKSFCPKLKPPDDCQGCVINHVNALARAARRFVQMENKGKMRMLDMRNVEFVKRKPITGLPKSPTYFSDQRIPEYARGAWPWKTKQRKVTRNKKGRG